MQIIRVCICVYLRMENVCEYDNGRPNDDIRRKFTQMLWGWPRTTLQQFQRDRFNRKFFMSFLIRKIISTISARLTPSKKKLIGIGIDNKTVNQIIMLLVLKNLIVCEAALHGTPLQTRKYEYRKSAEVPYIFFNLSNLNLLVVVVGNPTILIFNFAQVPFQLTLRVWDIFVLEGEKVLTAMAFNILKLHRKRIQQLGMDDILQFLQVQNGLSVRFFGIYRI